MSILIDNSGHIVYHEKNSASNQHYLQLLSTFIDNSGQLRKFWEIWHWCDNSCQYAKYTAELFLDTVTVRNFTPFKQIVHKWGVWLSVISTLLFQA